MPIGSKEMFLHLKSDNHPYDQNSIKKYVWGVELSFSRVKILDLVKLNFFISISKDF